MPFTIDQFLDSIAFYNETVWPAQLVLNAAALLTLALVWKRRSTSVAAILAALWLWIGFAYHYRVFSTINPAAYFFAVAFITQGALFVWFGVARQQFRFDGFSRTPRHFVGLGLVAYALLVYPITSCIAGHAYPQMPTFGLPCPTLIFTFGLLGLASAAPWQLFVIPVLWAVIGISAALNLGMLEDLALLPAAFVAIAIRSRHIRQKIKLTSTEIASRARTAPNSTRGALM